MSGGCGGTTFTGPPTYPKYQPWCLCHAWPIRELTQYIIECMLLHVAACLGGLEQLASGLLVGDKQVQLTAGEGWERHGPLPFLHSLHSVDSPELVGIPRTFLQMSYHALHMFFHATFAHNLTVPTTLLHLTPRLAPAGSGTGQDRVTICKWYVAAPRPCLNHS